VHQVRNLRPPALLAMARVIQVVVVVEGVVAAVVAIAAVAVAVIKMEEVVQVFRVRNGSGAPAILAETVARATIHSVATAPLVPDRMAT